MHLHCAVLEVTGEFHGGDQIRKVQQIVATGSSFAAILADGSHTGRDSARVVDLLRHVQQIHATHSAFAAVLIDRSVLAWGEQDMGGDHTAVMDELRNVQHIHATAFAFAGQMEAL